MDNCSQTIKKYCKNFSIYTKHITFAIEKIIAMTKWTLNKLNSFVYEKN